VTVSNNKKNLEKSGDEPNASGYHFNYALMLAMVSLVLLAIVFGLLYFIFFVEIKDLKSGLNSKLSKNVFVLEKEKLENLRVGDLKSEKEFLLSKIDKTNDLIKSISEDIDRKINATIAEDFKNKTKNAYINQEVSKKQLDKLIDFQIRYKEKLDLLQQQISLNQELIEKNKNILSVLRSSYQNIEKKQTSETSQELFSLIEEFTDISYYALKNEIKVHEKMNWRDWVTSYIQTIFISRSTQPIDGDHTDAVLSRIEYALKSGNLESAKREIGNLSSETRAVMKEWIRKLEKLIETEDQISQ
jgi:hypothetical protein